MNPKGISPLLALSAGRMRGVVNLGLLMITSSRACFQISTRLPNRHTARHSESWRRNSGIRVRNYTSKRAAARAARYAARANGAIAPPQQQHNAHGIALGN
jgi:hypothetical protein